MTRRALLGWSALAAVAVLFVVAYTALARTSGTPLDPRNPSRNGAQAVASVLADQGVDVHVVRRADRVDRKTPSGSTLVVTDPDALTPEVLRSLLQTPATRLVVIDPDADTVDAMGIPVQTHPAGSSTRRGRCAVDWARGLRISGVEHLYSPMGAAQARGCLSGSGGSALLTVQGNATAPTVVLVGSTAVLQNHTVTHEDNAAMALRLLGRTHTLVWFSADPAGPDTVAAPNPWPRWLRPGLLVAIGATVVMLFWRGRRLGPLVRELLPAVVPAREITIARGQLYRKNKDVSHSSIVLRSATRERLRSRLGLPRGAGAPALVEATARASGRDPTEISELLYGPPSTDETAMTDVAQQLDAIERQVRI